MQPLINILRRIRCKITTAVKANSLGACEGEIGTECIYQVTQLRKGPGGAG